MRTEPSSGFRSTLVAGAILFLLSVVRVADAHDPATIYGARWAAADAGAVNIYPGTTITGSYKSRTGDGAKAWDNQGQTLNFVMQSTPDPVYPATCDAGHNQNMVYRGGLDNQGGTFARTIYCYDLQTGIIDNYYMKFDIAENWSLNGEGVLAPNGTLDWYSVAAHEFGHAGGWEVHFTDPSICPNPVDVTISQTMCSNMPYSDGTQRGSYGRTLSPAHDIDTFAQEY